MRSEPANDGIPEYGEIAVEEMIDTGKNDKRRGGAKLPDPGDDVLRVHDAVCIALYNKPGRIQLAPRHEPASALRRRRNADKARGSH